MSVTLSTYARDELDFYVEPAWCVDLLLDNEVFIDDCLDPACGLRTIVSTVRKRGITCWCSDIVERLPNTNENDLEPDNFLEYTLDPYHSVPNIICNPPFKYAVPFCLRALEVTRHKVAMLLPLSFLASQKRKAELFDPHPPARVYVLSRRPSMPPGQMLIDNPEYVGKGGSVDYCWIVWDHGAKGPTQMEWLA